MSNEGATLSCGDTCAQPKGRALTALKSQEHAANHGNFKTKMCISSSVSLSASELDVLDEKPPHKGKNRKFTVPFPVKHEAPSISNATDHH